MESLNAYKFKEGRKINHWGKKNLILAGVINGGKLLMILLFIN